MIFEIAVYKVWDVRSGPSFPDPTNLLLFFLSCALPFAVYCSGQFSVQNLCQTALELQSELSDCSCILSWSHSTIWHDILVLTNLQGFTENEISHQHKQATFLLLRVKTAVLDLLVQFQSQGTGFENAPTKSRETEHLDIPTSNIGSSIKTRHPQYWPVEISQLNSISRCLISPCKSLLDCNVFNPQLHHLFNFSSTLPFLAFNVPLFLELHKVMR